MAEAHYPSVVVVDYKAPKLYLDYMAVVKLFVSYPRLYSWPYIAYMRSELSETGAMRIDNTKCFLDLLNHSAVSFAENDILRLSK